MRSLAAVALHDVKESSMTFQNQVHGQCRSSNALCMASDQSLCGLVSTRCCMETEKRSGARKGPKGDIVVSNELMTLDLEAAKNTGIASPS